MPWACGQVHNAPEVTSSDGQWSCVATDADGDPHAWRLTWFSIRRPWWEISSKRRLSVDQVINGGSDMLVVSHEPAHG
jgi:hypothetical protein